EVKGDKASTERALSLASRLALSRNPSHLDSLGWIHYQLGQYDKAVPLLERAVALSSASPLLQLHLGKALVKSGNETRGRELIKRAIASKAVLPRIEEARAMLGQG
ncbi:MAG: tetratricopeptide repeat protein, partial [Chitinophagaceae bacterium]|nr:tetratricopeptide repeat protein [Rubrivivax sp.]